MKVLFNRIFVKAPDTERTSESGLVLHVEQSLSGILSSEVAFVGEKVDSSIEVGDTVYFPGRAGVTFKRGNDEYLVLDEKDIIAVE